MTVDEIFKATLIVLEIGIMEPRAQVLGGVGIFDLQGLGLNHTFHMSPDVARKMIAMMVVSWKSFFSTIIEIKYFLFLRFLSVLNIFQLFALFKNFFKSILKSKSGRLTKGFSRLQASFSCSNLK